MTGSMMAGLTIATIVTRALFGSLIDEWGRKKTLLLGSILFTVNTFAYYLVKDLTGLFILRICNGISQGIFFPVPPTVVSDNVSGEDLSDALGIFGICSSLPVAFAPTLGLWVYKRYGADTLFMLTTVTALFAVGLAMCITDRYVPQKARFTLKEKMDIKQIVEVSAILPSVIYMFMYFGYSSITNFVTPYGMEKGIAGDRQHDLSGDRGQCGLSRYDRLYGLVHPYAPCVCPAGDRDHLCSPVNAGPCAGSCR